MGAFSSVNKIDRQQKVFSDDFWAFMKSTHGAANQIFERKELTSLDVSIKLKQINRIYKEVPAGATSL